MHAACTHAACTLHARCTHARCTLHAACTLHARGTHTACTRHARGMHAACAGCTLPVHINAGVPSNEPLRALLNGWEHEPAFFVPAAIYTAMQAQRHASRTRGTLRACTRRAHAAHTACTLHPPYTHPTPTRHPHGMHTACTRRAHGVRTGRFGRPLLLSVRYLVITPPGADGRYAARLLAG